MPDTTFGVRHLLVASLVVVCTCSSCQCSLGIWLWAFIWSMCVVPGLDILDIYCPIFISFAGLQECSCSPVLEVLATCSWHIVWAEVFSCGLPSNNCVRNCESKIWSGRSYCDNDCWSRSDRWDFSIVLYLSSCEVLNALARENFVHILYHFRTNFFKIFISRN